MLAIIVVRAKEDAQVKGVVRHLVEDGLSVLRCTDNTVIFMDHDFDQAEEYKITSLHL